MGIQHYYLLLNLTEYSMKINTNFIRFIIARFIFYELFLSFVHFYHVFCLLSFFIILVLDLKHLKHECT